MRSKQLFLCSLLTAVAVIFCSSRAYAADMTAKAGLAQAQESARTRKADVALVQILSLSGSMDGTAGMWSFLFHSPQAKKGYKVDVKDGTIDQVLEVSSSFI